MLDDDKTFTDGGRIYVSVEPFHWGMFPLPSPQPRDWLEGLRSYQKRFEPHTWPNVRIDA
jgi:L-ascorbate metabolism protein UlaG (beta-lactamase superfamily)